MAFPVGFAGFFSGNTVDGRMLVCGGGGFPLRGIFEGLAAGLSVSSNLPAHFSTGSGPFFCGRPGFFIFLDVLAYETGPVFY